MNHDITHCTGKSYPESFMNGEEPVVCPMRKDCKRYKAFLALENDKDTLPQGMAVSFIQASDCLNNNNILFQDI